MGVKLEWGYVCYCGHGPHMSHYLYFATVEEATTFAKDYLKEEKWWINGKPIME